MARSSALPQYVRDSFAGPPNQIMVTGPRRFVRAASATQNPYGHFWFEAATLLGLQQQFDRIPLPPGHRRDAIRGQLRAGGAISVDWNALSEFWLLELPTGQSLNAFVGPANAQPVHSIAHRLHDAKVMLRGGLVQYYFPVLNPLWVYRFGSYMEL